MEFKILRSILILVGISLFLLKINHDASQSQNKGNGSQPKAIFMGVINNPGRFYTLLTIEHINSFNQPTNSEYIQGYDSRKIEIYFERKSLLDSILMNFTKYPSIQSLKLINFPFEHLHLVISKFENLIYLKLDDCTITRPSEFLAQLSKKKYLKYLDLNECKIIDVPDNIGLLKNLVELRINQDSIGFISDSIGSLIHLEYLSLNGNISSFPESIGNLSAMKEIDLSGNPIAQFPPQIYKMKLIQSINLTFTNISEVPIELAKLKYLRKICLVNTKVQEEITEGKFLEWQISELKKKSNIRVFFNFYDDPMEKLR